MNKTETKRTNVNTVQMQPRVMARACKMALPALLALGAVHTSQALADSFTLDNGDQGQWMADMSLGNTWRTMHANPALYSKVYGGTGGDGNQNGDLNFGKGDPVSTPFTLSGELQLKHDNLGVVLGARAWYDYTLENKTAPVGSANNGYVANTKLNDQGFYPLSKFSGAALNNAYLFGTFEPVDGKPLTIKLGDQVVNWGESLFIPGINQFGAFNLVAAHQVGTTVKDILLPIPQISANWGLGSGFSVESFYQFMAVKNVADGCGTFWSPSDVYNCGSANPVLLGDSTGVNQFAQANGMTPLNAVMGAINMPTYHPNFTVGNIPDKDARNSGQFGLALHYYEPVTSIDFGVYGAAFNQRTPMLDFYRVAAPSQSSVFSGTFNGLPPSALLGAIGTLTQKATAAANAAAAAQAGGNGAAAAAYAAGAKQAAAAATALGGLYPLVSPVSGGWDYSAPTQKEFGLSAASELGGWSISGETSYTVGVPVQLNPADMVVGDLMGNLPAALGPGGALLKANAGPLAGFASQPNGALLKGYDLHDKAQFQMNTAKVFSQVAGADSLTLVGEVGVQHWSGIENPGTPGATLYGRGFTYGFATNNAMVCAKLNANPAYCSTNGFDTASAWGYRMQAELSYPNVIAGWSLKPRVFWSQDVHGTSGDGLFLQDRHALGLVLRTEYLNKYYAQIAYTTYNHNATYDPMNDRDNIAAVAGIHF